MAAASSSIVSLLPFVVQSLPRSTLSALPKLLKRGPSFRLTFSLAQSNGVLGLLNTKKFSVPERGLYSICFYNAKEESKSSFKGKETGLDWPILKRWDVPWKWQTVSLTMFACGISLALTGLVETSVLQYLGLQIGELSLDEKAELLFVNQIIVTAIVLGVIYGFTSTFQTLSDDIFCFDRKEPFSLRKGWLLWAGVGLAGALLTIALTGAAMTFFSGKSPQRELRGYDIRELLQAY